MATTAMPSVSIGNYKGVMLCNRPFVGVQPGYGGYSNNQSGSKGAFVCGHVESELGGNVPMSSKERPAAAENRPKKKTTLMKHKQWLRALQKTKVELEEQARADVEAKEERQKRFSERESRMRQMVRDAKTKSKEESKEDYGVAEAKDAEDDASSRGRPMWALTEEQAEKAAEERELDEVEDLLDFAQGLDYDKYINDAEVSALIDNVRNRIHELEADAKVEAKGESRAAETILLTKIAALTADNLASHHGSEVAERKDDDAVSVALSILESEAGRSVGSIHSHKSLAAVTETRKAKLATRVMAPLQEEPLQPPRIVMHDDYEGARLEGKNTVQNLPYMHRNPAV